MLKSRRLEEMGEDQEHSNYWGDGSIRVGGREYGAMLDSPCYQGGTFSCLSCHSMHKSDPNDQLASRMTGNHACTQCHTQAKYVDRIEKHTHHKKDSVGSLCYNCHMPFTSYAVLTAIRSHRIDSPHVTTSVRTGRPNACNLCHLDRTLDWTAQRLSNWYGTETFELNEEEKSIAASLLWLLKGDAAQRIVTAWHLGWSSALEASGKEWQAPFLAKLLEDPYAAVRFVARRSLNHLPGSDKFTYDFVGPVEERSRVRKHVLEFWKRNHQFRSGDNGLKLFFDSNHELREELIDQLFKQRDDRPIHISE